MKLFINLKGYLPLFVLFLCLASCSEREDVKKAKKTVVPKSNVDPVFKSQMDKLFMQYIALKEACIEGDEAKAKSLASIMNQFISHKVDISKLDNEDFFSWGKQQENLSFCLEDIVSNSKMDNARLNFGDMYGPMYKLMTKYGMGSKTIYIQACPMAFDSMGGKWFSLDDNIENPFFGDKMLECGSNTEVVNFE